MRNLCVVRCPLSAVGRASQRLRLYNTQRATRHQQSKGFTLIECLSAMFLMALVLPAVNLGIASATKSAGLARHRSEAAQMASSKLSELIASAQWNGGTLSGDFGPDWPDYHWQATVNSWINDTQAVGLQQLDVTVSWPKTGRQESVMVSSLVYVRPTPSS